MARMTRMSLASNTTNTMESRMITTTTVRRMLRKELIKMITMLKITTRRLMRQRCRLSKTKSMTSSKSKKRYAARIARRSQSF